MGTVATIPAAAASQYDNQEMIATIKQTVCKGATDAELRMFIEVCKSTGLNPFLKEIWWVPDKKIIMAARDGYLRVANEDPQFDGIETRVERDDKNLPIKAVCTVWRKDRSHPTICEAYFSEYRGSGPVWQKYPSAMISKVAEVLALKRSFAINGVVSEEEMAASNDPRGSKEAAQEVLHQKLAAVAEKSPTLPMIEAPHEEIIEGETEDVPLSHEEQVFREVYTALAAQSGKKVKPYDKFKMLPEIQNLKKRFQVIGREDAYYAVLNRCGAKKSNELPSDDGGLMARVAFKVMGIFLGELEPPTVDKLPDPIEQVAGAWAIRDGKLYQVVDTPEGHIWQEGK